MKLTEGQKKVMEAEGHLLVTGGPGSGKTTISILKAAQLAERNLRPGQKILFLSFARATVSRVEEAIEHEQRIPLTQKRVIDVETYHSFFWRVLKTHGYLVELPRRLSILTPPSEAVALSSVRLKFPARGLTEAQKEVNDAEKKMQRMRNADASRLTTAAFALISLLAMLAIFSVVAPASENLSPIGILSLSLMSSKILTLINGVWCRHWKVA